MYLPVTMLFSHLRAFVDSQASEGREKSVKVPTKLNSLGISSLHSKLSIWFRFAGNRIFSVSLPVYWDKTQKEIFFLIQPTI